jgi:KUP system potassium uptake protein
VTGPATPPPNHGPIRASVPLLALGALGVVYGDIGTSPLYALKLCFTGSHALPVRELEVLGILSLVFWTLICVVSVQYLTFILRADNRGEGGDFSLLALVPENPPGSGKRPRAVIILVLAGAALLYGDGVITPAISVLSAVEGLEIVTHEAEPFVVPLAVVILLALFLVQRRGTWRIGRVFGPIMLFWFLTIGVLGAIAVANRPQVLRALDPRWAVNLFLQTPGPAFVALGAVVLCITGAEALYVDMGHFGKKAIRRSWHAVVLPSLLLCYLGQGALLLQRPEDVVNPFYRLVPRPLLLPMVGLATMATVIASQALISGVFSLTRQAMQLGFLPRLRIVHTSSLVQGQIYVPLANNLLMVACLLLVVGFRRSEALASAYGVAVTGAMTTTAIVFGVVARRRWKWSLARVIPLVAAFLLFSLSFFSASLVKVLDGGWIPLLLATAAFILMDTWKTGRQHLMHRFAERTLTIDRFVHDLKAAPLHRVPGTAVFLSSSPKMAPVALLHHVRHSRVLHARVLILSFVTTDVPAVRNDERMRLEDLGLGLWRITVDLGFMEGPDVVASLKSLRGLGLVIAHEACTYYLSRETLDVSGPSHMSAWRKKLFAFAARNAQTPASFFGLPPGQVVELGARVDL